LIFRSAAAAEREQERTELLEQIAQRDRQLQILQRQLDELERRQRAESGNVDLRQELASLRVLVEQIEADRRADQETLATIAAPAPSARTGLIAFEQPERITYRRSEFGRFYALLIGVEQYELLDDLAS